MIIRVNQENPRLEILVRTAIKIVRQDDWVLNFFSDVLVPVKDKNWLEAYEIELEFLEKNYSEVLPKILYDVIRKRVKDPVHYIVHKLIKYKIDKSMNIKWKKFVIDLIYFKFHLYLKNCWSNCMHYLMPFKNSIIGSK